MKTIDYEAILQIHNSDQIPADRRQEIADWLRRSADDFLNRHDQMASVFTGRFMKSDAIPVVERFSSVQQAMQSVEHAILLYDPRALRFSMTDVEGAAFSDLDWFPTAQEAAATFVGKPVGFSRDEVGLLCDVEGARVRWRAEWMSGRGWLEPFDKIEAVPATP